MVEREISNLSARVRFPFPAQDEVVGTYEGSGRFPKGG